MNQTLKERAKDLDEILEDMQNNETDSLRKMEIRNLRSPIVMLLDRENDEEMLNSALARMIELQRDPESAGLHSQFRNSGHGSILSILNY